MLATLASLGTKLKLQILIIYLLMVARNLVAKCWKQNILPEQGWMVTKSQTHALNE